jgi:hypothetical protein
MCGFEQSDVNNVLVALLNKKSVVKELLFPFIVGSYLFRFSVRILTTFKIVPSDFFTIITLSVTCL